MSIISVQEAEKYGLPLLRRSIDEHFNVLDVEKDLRTGMKVLIKPNLLTARRPELTVTTHPVVLSAICDWLLDHGISDITIADSPGGPYMAANLKTVYHQCGISFLSDKAKLNLDSGWQSVQCEEGFLNRSFNIINPICEADYIINVAKLKTHGMTMISAGIKNLFGAIPGLQKPELHFRYPDPEDFARMLLEVAMVVKPHVTVIDAVEAMEGNGPNSGTKRHLGLTFASRDMFELDYYAATIMGFDPCDVLMLKLALERGFIKPDEIEIKGFRPSPADPPFKLPDSLNADLLKILPAFLRRPIRSAANRILRPFPEVDIKKCIGCEKCAESCPTRIIIMKNGKAHMTKKNCISCFCCQEMCPAKAINARRMIKL